MEFQGVMPAITTPFDPYLGIDHPFLARHLSWLAEHGCTGIVPLGSLGEGNTLELDEKIAIVESCQPPSRVVPEEVIVATGLIARRSTHWSEPDASRTFWIRLTETVGPSAAVASLDVRAKTEAVARASAARPPRTGRSTPRPRSCASWPPEPDHHHQGRNHHHARR